NPVTVQGPPAVGEVEVSPRQFMYAAGTYRGSTSGFALDGSTRKTGKQVIELKPMPGNPNRYVASDGGLEWQGGFRHNDPAGNLSLADSYNTYLGRSAGGFDKPLSVRSTEGR